MGRGLTAFLFSANPVIKNGAIVEDPVIGFV
jgi:hypothetical protein